MSCPQCHEAINGADTKTYAVGWCKDDVHRDCLPLHIRACAKCRPHNEAVLYRIDDQRKSRPMVVNL